MDDWQAAIVPDEMLDRSLSDLSAVEFLQVLHHPHVGRHMKLVADKKKYELWVEEGPVLKLNIRQVVEKLKTEKKKAELEIPDEIGPVIRWPEIERARLVEEVADLVAIRMRKGG